MYEDIVSYFLDPSGQLSSNLAKEAAYAISRDMDAFILGLRAAIQQLGGASVINSSNTGGIGTTEVSSPLTINNILTAKTFMDESNIPAMGRVLIVSPVQYNQLLAQDKTQNMFYRTSAPLESGIVGTIFGIPVYMTSMINANSLTGFLNGTVAIPTPGVQGAGMVYYPDQDLATSLPLTWGTTNNATGAPRQVHTALLMQSDLLAMAVLQEPKTEMSRESLYLSDAMITSSLYGARLYRPDHGVIIHTNAVLPLT